MLMLQDFIFYGEMYNVFSIHIHIRFRQRSVSLTFHSQEIGNENFKNSDSWVR